MSSEHRLILVRHGASEWSEEKRYQGHSPVPLTTYGLQQAHDLAAKIHQEYNPEQIISSDLERTLQTAEIIAEHLQLDIHFDRRLRELDCGKWVGLTIREIEDMDSQNVAEIRAGKDLPRGEGETLSELKTRVCSALDDWLKDRFFSTKVIISHAYVIQAIIQILSKKTLHCINHLPYLGSYTTLKKTKGNTWTIEKYSVLPNENFSSEALQWLPTL